MTAAAALAPEAIASGAAELGLPLDAAQVDALGRYAQLLLRWNSVHNLTAIAAPSQVLTHHLLDSLAVVPPLLRLAQGRALHLLDVGAGGGLPGIALAVALPQWRFTLLDKVGKKVAFLTQVALELKLTNVEPVQQRVEHYRPAQPFDGIISRAFAALADFVGLTDPLLAPEGFWAAMKATDVKAEVAALPATARLAADVPLHVPGLGAQRRLLIVVRTGAAVAAATQG
jgi:16S rRNA (guanine527-N7)-methyltransferase